MSTISMSDVNLSYPNGFQALRDVNLEIAHGEVVGLHGASGSGKSTVLRAVAGLEPIDSGSIVVGGKIWLVSLLISVISAWCFKMVSYLLIVVLPAIFRMLWRWLGLVVLSVMSVCGR